MKKDISMEFLPLQIYYHFIPIDGSMVLLFAGIEAV